VLMGHARSPSCFSHARLPPLQAVEAYERALRSNPQSSCAASYVELLFFLGGEKNEEHATTLLRRGLWLTPPPPHCPFIACPFRLTMYRSSHSGCTEGGG